MTGITLQDGQASLPSRNSTSSYWHKDPSPVLLGHRTTPDLPRETDVVIIGSGITGAFVARKLVGGGKGVVMLESREACWGATGRNGGHCQPVLYLRESHIAQFELDTYNFLKDLVEEHSIPCDWKTVGGVHGLSSQAALALVQERVAQLNASHPELASLVRVVTGRAALDELRLGPGAVGAVVQTCAAQCWPYRLVSWVLEGLLRRSSGGDAAGSFNLQTGTSALHLQRSGGVWVVHTDRGQIVARDVVLATNAYTSHLLPAFTNLITPVRGQVASLVYPPSSSSSTTAATTSSAAAAAAAAEPAPQLKHSHVWVDRQEGDAGESEDYLIHRATGELILGGERLTTAEAGWGTSDDGAATVDPVVSRRLHAALHRALTGFPREMGDTYEWTGIMGYSADGNPWVGGVPEGLGGGLGGLWVSAGYTGHGMPVAARCGIAVGEMVLGERGQGTVNVPPEWAVSEGRVSAAKTTTMPQTFQDELLQLVEASRQAPATQ